MDSQFWVSLLKNYDRKHNKVIFVIGSFLKFIYTIVNTYQPPVPKKTATSFYCLETATILLEPEKLCHLAVLFHQELECPSIKRFSEASGGTKIEGGQEFCFVTIFNMIAIICS